ncbi:DUF4132 domain-containing protein [Streptomyces venezuelae]|uniref:DUF4132 domain-containing protein n=1 Tax=Streptomyces venezuelae TaxID=54571 RepID=UPI0037903DB5
MTAPADRATASPARHAATGSRARHVAAVARLAAAGDMTELADELLAAAISNGNQWDGDGDEIFVTLRGLPAAERTRLAHALTEAADPPTGHQPITSLLILLEVIAHDLPGDLLSAARVRRLKKHGTVHCVWSRREAMALAEAELAAGHPIPATVVAALRRTARVDPHGRPGLAPLLARLPDPVVNPGEAWADRALTDLARRDAPWHDLVRHAASATSAKPSAEWDRTARALLGPLDSDEVRDTLLDWLALVGRPRTLPFDGVSRTVAPNEEYDPYNADVLRGLTWLLALLPAHPATARTLGTLVEVSLRKIPGVGPRNVKVANAGVAALVRSDGDAALAELARLASRVTSKTTLKLIEAGLEQRAEALGLTREEVAELAVPTYGLTEVGRALHRIGDCEAELTVHGPKAALRWRNETGRQLKAAPAAVRRDHPGELKELKAAVKDIDKMLPAKTERLDRQFLARRRWPYEAWRERYADHPLLGTLARRLLWTVDDTPCGYVDGELRTLDGEPVRATPGAAVRLWHPVGRDPAEIVAWRERLERHGVTQPFKQAHREVYVLTDAERTTRTYSNRFAAHILRQHQFNSLAAARGWHNRLRLSVDDEYPPATRELPEWGLRAEYWIEGDGGERRHEDLTEAGSYLRVRTDQVRFYPIDAPRNTAHAGGGAYRMELCDGREPVEPVPLEEIPDLVLSEVFRDVDLFVGVASVGADPTWQDGGPGGRFREYWTAYGFGDLGPSAVTRRDLLARLLPRLTIGDRCTVEGRFLHVRGDLHTYKIHLGSGNILRSPADQYVCIVPASRSDAPGADYLPFEGDRTLSLILSKALLLAGDADITDPTIRSQL